MVEMQPSYKHWSFHWLVPALPVLVPSNRTKKNETKACSNLSLFLNKVILREEKNKQVNQNHSQLDQCLALDEYCLQNYSLCYANALEKPSPFKVKGLYPGTLSRKSNLFAQHNHGAVVLFGKEPQKSWCLLELPEIVGSTNF